MNPRLVEYAFFEPGEVFLPVYPREYGLDEFFMEKALGGRPLESARVERGVQTRQHGVPSESFASRRFDERVETRSYARERDVP